MTRDSRGPLARAMIFLAVVVLGLVAIFAGGCALILLTDDYFGSPGAGAAMAVIAALAGAGIWLILRRRDGPRDGD